MVVKFVEIICDCEMGYRAGGYCKKCIDGMNAEIKDLEDELFFKERELKRLMAARKAKISEME